MVDLLRAVAPGRVNLIGDHTDHTGGSVLPMAIDLATTVEVELRDDGVVELESDQVPGIVRFELGSGAAGGETSTWGRYVAAVASALGPAARGVRGRVSSTVPVGGGLSSSAALTVAVALALGADPDDPIALAQLCRAAEHDAVGVPCGLMDPLASIAGVEGCALLIDIGAERVDTVPIPEDVDVVVVDSGVGRTLEGSPYAERRDRCVAASVAVGSLRDARLEDLDAIPDPAVRAAGRHVITENRRVREVADALASADLVAVGAAMQASHASLRDDLGVSTPAIDRLVERLVAVPGVFGARLTGAGFGGYVVALAERGSLDEGRLVRPSAGARLSPPTTR